MFLDGDGHVPREERDGGVELLRVAVVFDVGSRGDVRERVYV